MANYQMDPAATIKDTLTMQDIYEKYGIKTERNGFICCPFHNEKTPSLKTYGENKKWKCFGCQRQGNVIDFVMGLFGVGFFEACKRIDGDFNLHLFEKPTLTQHRARQKELKLLKQKRQQEKEKTERLKRDFSLFCAIARNIKVPNEDTLYAENLAKISAYAQAQAEHLMHQLEDIK